jgi:mono/diheme cytochrome c family protein
VVLIQDGNEPLMPAFRDKLSQAQNLGLTIYVRAFAIEPGVRAKTSVATAPKQETAAKEVAPPRVNILVSEKSISAPLAPSQMQAVQLYRAYCMACHDADGKGGTVRQAMPDIPDFTDAKWQAGRSNNNLSHSVLEGKGKFMLPMKSKLGIADATALVDYVRGFRAGKQVVRIEPKEIAPRPQQPIIVPTPVRLPKPPALSPPATDDSATRTRVASINYRQYCLSCHGTDGRGAEIRSGMPAIPDFKSAAWQESRTNAQLAASILEGKGTLMPAFRGRVNAAQAQDLAPISMLLVRRIYPRCSLGRAISRGAFVSCRRSGGLCISNFKR